LQWILPNAALGVTDAPLMRLLGDVLRSLDPHRGAAVFQVYLDGPEQAHTLLHACAAAGFAVVRLLVDYPHGTRCVVFCSVLLCVARPCDVRSRPAVRDALQPAEVLFAGTRVSTCCLSTQLS
jgi:hypothetical protein